MNLQRSDTDNTHTVHRILTYPLPPPSSDINKIRNAIVRRYCRKRKQKQRSQSFTASPNELHNGKQAMLLPSSYGLPSPPGDSSPSTGDRHDHSHSMTADEIHKKLFELKQEKHRLFQLIKRLVQEEAASYSTLGAQRQDG